MELMWSRCNDWKPTEQQAEYGMMLKVILGDSNGIAEGTYMIR